MAALPPSAGYPQLAESGEGFPLVRAGRPAAVWVAPGSPPGLSRVAEWFADDLERVSGKRPEIHRGGAPPRGDTVAVGVLGAGAEMDRLATAAGIDSAALSGQWEASATAIAPRPGDEGSLLVVAGSDKRGAIYGLLDLSRAAGVSPWWWWADAPTPRRSELLAPAGPVVRGPPKVRYRGIFLNDEAPALADWAQEKFGGCNHRFYERVFELLLRQRANYLWPAMWGRSLFDDDPESQRLADELGVVLATSHHEPMQRAHVEWARYGKGPWDYARNAEVLRDFWREGVRRMGRRESVVTLGMRGDGDEPMSDDANIALLQQIVRDQREILSEELGAAAATQPQVWALYKEVQEYYDRGMTVPDDVTLLLCDDNWGNVRRLPRPEAPRRPGGYGMYYHFDYVGDPRNYKWLNANSIPRVWEQMWLTWAHGVDRIWVVNVGDLKPMEEPIDFFLMMAWNPERFSPAGHADTIAEWRRAWCVEQFAGVDPGAAASLLSRYAQLAARRKPELLDATTYSDAEWEAVKTDWNALAEEAERLEKTVPAAAASAYYQLVLHPILAMQNLHELYCAVNRNRTLAAAGDARANAYADAAEKAFARDGELTQRYHTLEGGKWNHMMAQTHIGYTSWQQPDVQAMPSIKRVDPSTKAAASNSKEANGRVALTPPPEAWGFVQEDGCVAIEAASTNERRGASGVEWIELPEHGKTVSAMMAIPVNAPSTPAGAGPVLEYPVWLTEPGPVVIDAYLSPTQDFYGLDDHGVRFAVSIDEAPPVTVDMHADGSTNERKPNNWRRRVADAIHVASTPPMELGLGPHTLKFWRVDTGAVLQRLVVRRREAPRSYLGPPASRFLPRADSSAIDAGAGP